MTFDLNLVRAFVEIVDAGNLSEAARRRGVTRSQVSKELKALEQQAGAMLLRRTTRRLAPTEQGRTLFEHGRQMLQEMELAQAAIDGFGKTVRGHVRLSIPTGLGGFFLSPHLLAFQAAHPEISLRVLFSNRVFDLIASDVDVAVRITSVPPPEQVARELGDIGWGLFAAPAYLAGRDPVRTPEALTGCDFVFPPSPERHFDLKLFRTAKGVPEERRLRVKPHLQSEHFPFLREATLAGIGVGLLPEYAVLEDLRTRRLRRVLPDWQAEGIGGKLMILTLRERHPSHAAQVLIDYLREVLKPIAGLARR